MNIEQVSNELEEKSRVLETAVEKTDVALAEMRLQFETMMEMQKEERLKMEELHSEEKDKMRKHYGRIIIGLIIALCVFIGGLFGTVAYFMMNYDVELGYVQDVSVGGDGNSTIYDGIHYNAD